nr:hypothetical protein CFP56_08028 [Quercus suber]
MIRKGSSRLGLDRVHGLSMGKHEATCYLSGHLPYSSPALIPQASACSSGRADADLSSSPKNGLLQRLQSAGRDRQTVPISLAHAAAAHADCHHNCSKAAESDASLRGLRPTAALLLKAFHSAAGTLLSQGRLLEASRSAMSHLPSYLIVDGLAISRRLAWWEWKDSGGDRHRDQLDGHMNDRTRYALNGILNTFGLRSSISSQAPSSSNRSTLPEPVV